MLNHLIVGPVEETEYGLVIRFLREQDVTNTSGWIEYKTRKWWRLLRFFRLYIHGHETIHLTFYRAIRKARRLHKDVHQWRPIS